MVATRSGDSSGEAPYLRASAGSDLDARRVGRWLAGLGVAVLGVLTVVTANGALHQSSVESRLHSAGVSVTVTVTECAGVSSGIGQVITYYDCTGSYLLDGHRYDETIGGDRAYHRPGSTLDGVAVPGAPALLSSAAALNGEHPSWTPYITPAVLAGLTAALALVLRRWTRRGRSRAQRCSSPA